MKSINFVLWQEGRYPYVAPVFKCCVASFGETIEEAIDNLKDSRALFGRDKVLLCLKSSNDWQRRIDA